MAVSEEDMGLKAEKTSQLHIENPSRLAENSEIAPPSYRETYSVLARESGTPPPSYCERSSVASGQSASLPPPYAETSSVPSGHSVPYDRDAASECEMRASSDLSCVASPYLGPIDDNFVYDKNTWLDTEKLAVKCGIYPDTPAPSGVPCVFLDDSTLVSEESFTTPVSSETSTTLVNGDSSHNDPWLSASTLAPVMGIYAMTPASSTENLVAGLKVDSEKDLESQSKTPYTAVPEDLWRYIPNKHEMWVRTIHEIGFLATTIFFCSSLLYFSTSIASFVTIAHTGGISRWIRYPQLVAAVGFAIASIILMLQVQKNWWRPALHRLRWYINFLNLIRSAGFIFCACFGLVDDVAWARYQFGCSYLWGSWAFLFGAMMQWYKFINKHQAAARRKEWVDDHDDNDKDLLL